MYILLPLVSYYPVIKGRKTIGKKTTLYIGDNDTGVQFILYIYISFLTHRIPSPAAFFARFMTAIPSLDSSIPSMMINSTP